MFQDGSGGRPTLLTDPKLSVRGHDPGEGPQARAVGTEDSPDQFRTAASSGGPGPPPKRGRTRSEILDRAARTQRPAGCKLHRPPKGLDGHLPTGESRLPTQSVVSAPPGRSAPGTGERHRLRRPCGSGNRRQRPAMGTELNPPGRRCGPTRLLLSSFTYS